MVASLMYGTVNIKRVDSGRPCFTMVGGVIIFVDQTLLATIIQDRMRNAGAVQVQRLISGGPRVARPSMAVGHRT